MTFGFKQIRQTGPSENGAESIGILHTVLTNPTLEDLLARVTPENLPDEADVSWGKLQGSEE